MVWSPQDSYIDILIKPLHWYTATVMFQNISLKSAAGSVTSSTELNEDGAQFITAVDMTVVGILRMI